MKFETQGELSLNSGIGLDFGSSKGISSGRSKPVLCGLEGRPRVGGGLHPIRSRHLDQLPDPVYEETMRVIAGLKKAPFRPGLGYQVFRAEEPLPLEAWVAHFLRDSYRILHVVDGNHLDLYGVGKRPGFYRKLDRLKKSIPGKSDSPAWADIRSPHDGYQPMPCPG